MTQRWGFFDDSQMQDVEVELRRHAVAADEPFMWKVVYSFVYGSDGKTPRTWPLPFWVRVRHGRIEYELGLHDDGPADEWHDAAHLVDLRAPYARVARLVEFFGEVRAAVQVTVRAS